MQALRNAIGIAWAIFWLYWLVSAAGAKASLRGRRRFTFPGLSVLIVVIVFRYRGGGLVVSSPILGVSGAVVFVAGLGLAIWARIHLGRNWGMPMTERAEPELATSGPYRFVRHPIYSGLLLGVLGSALATNLVGLIIVAVLCAYFYYSATIEEKNLTATFPTQYPAYRAATKMLIPFIL